MFGSLFKMGTLHWKVAWQMFQKLRKTPPKWPKIKFIWVKYHVFCYELYMQAPNGSVIIPRQTRARIAFTGVCLLCRQTHGMLLQEGDRGWNEEEQNSAQLLIMAKRFDIWMKVIKQTTLSWDRSIPLAQFQLPVGGATYQKSVLRVFLWNGKSSEKCQKQTP